MSYQPPERTSDRAVTETTDLEREIAAFGRAWEQIVDVPEHPRTLMDVIEYSLGDQQKAEVYVTRLLRYFLDPEAPHGLGSDLLDAFVERLADVCDFEEDTYDLSDVSVRDQVQIEYGETVAEDGVRDRTGYADLVLDVPGEWFLVIELKFSAGENDLDGDGLSQTEFYYDAPVVGAHRKTDYGSGSYYLYVHPASEPAAESDEFSTMHWREFTSGVVEDFLVANGPRLPQRTVRQLREFVDDIEDISGMSDQTEHEREKVELYVDHYDAIADVSEAFDSRWDEFTREWWTQLRRAIDDEVDADWFGIEGVDDWAYLFKRGWWRNRETLEPVDEYGEYDTVRVGFLHRLDHHRELAVGDRTLKFQFRNCPPNRHLENEETNFRDAFYEHFEGHRSEIRETLPEAAELTGNMHNLIEATYDIPVKNHQNFFDAYVAALERAFVEHALENEALGGEIDAVYRETLRDFE